MEFSYKKTHDLICDVEVLMNQICKWQMLKGDALADECEIDVEGMMEAAVKQLAVKSQLLTLAFYAECRGMGRLIQDLTEKVKEAEDQRDEALRERAKIDHPSSPAVRSAVHALTNGHCAYCDDKLGDDWQVEHVVPASLGGPDSIANYVPSCKPCNHKKSTKHVIEFIKLRRGKFAVVEGDKAAEA